MMLTVLFCFYVLFATFREFPNGQGEGATSLWKSSGRSELLPTLQFTMRLMRISAKILLLHSCCGQCYTHSAPICFEIAFFKHDVKYLFSNKSPKLSPNMEGVALIQQFSPLVCGEFAVLHVAYVPPEELPPPDPSSAPPPDLVLNANGVQEVHAEQAGLLVHAGDVGVGDGENTLLHFLHFHLYHTEKTSFSFLLNF